MPGVMQRTVERRPANVLKVKPQVRKTFPPEEGLRALAQSVMKRQIHPLIIQTDNTILDGECRWRGVMLERPDHELDVIVVDRDLRPGEAGEMQMISAMHSTSLTAYDQAVACRDWLAAHPGATAKELAEKIDRDPSMLTKLTSLWRTIPEVVKAAEEGKCGPGDWYAISKLPPDQQQEALALKLSGASRDAIEQHGRKRRNGNGTPAVRIARVKLPMPSGTSVTVAGNELSLDDVIETLSELIKDAKKANDQGLDVKTFARVCADRAGK